ncbi:hypothetical protein C8Q78DRAFT_702759 [Trametes maxima]|nr:hypothetical protein C8Q78DRAFT_702759 [Trametes maxima]
MGQTRPRSPAAGLLRVVGLGLGLARTGAELDASPSRLEAGGAHIACNVIARRDLSAERFPWFVQIPITVCSKLERRAFREEGLIVGGGWVWGRGQGLEDAKVLDRATALD